MLCDNEEILCRRFMTFGPRYQQTKRLVFLHYTAFYIIKNFTDMQLTLNNISSMTFWTTVHKELYITQSFHGFFALWHFFITWHFCVAWHFTLPNILLSTAFFYPMAFYNTYHFILHDIYNTWHFILHDIYNTWHFILHDILQYLEFYITRHLQYLAFYITWHLQ